MVLCSTLAGPLSFPSANDWEQDPSHNNASADLPWPIDLASSNAAETPSRNHSTNVALSISYLLDVARIDFT